MKRDLCGFCLNNVPLNDFLSLLSNFLVGCCCVDLHFAYEALKGL